MFDPLRVWSAANRARLLAIALSTTAAIAVADWWHPTYISLGFLYLLPIMIAGGYLNRASILALAFVCAGLQELFGDLPRHESAVRFMLAASGFAATGLFVSEAVRSRFLASKHVAALEEQIRLRREAEEELQALVENSPAAIVTIDAEGRILLSNDAARDLFAPGEGPLEGRDISIFMPALLSAVKTRPPLAFHTSLQGRATRANGDVFVAAAWFSTYSTSTGPRLAAIVVDSSEDLRAREDTSLHDVLRHTRIVMSAVAHEIRNITAAVVMAHRNLSRLPALVNNEDFTALGTLVGTLERIAGEQLHPLAVSEPDTLDLGSLLDELRVVTQPSLEEGGVSSAWPQGSELPMVVADRNALMQVFLNLVRNSVQAMEPSGSGMLRVTAAVEGVRIVVRFSDNGCGVRNPEALFRALGREDGAGGVGLFISRAIARSFGGDLVHEPSEAGACFAVSLRAAGVGEEGTHA